MIARSATQALGRRGPPPTPRAAASGSSRSGPAWAAASTSASSSSASGSIRSSGAPVSTWLPVLTSSSRTRPANGACSTVSIFMLSRTSTLAPAATVSPTATGVATTSAGAGERSMPPSSRVTRWVTPSTSTSCTGPCVAVTSLNRCPPIVSTAVEVVDPGDLGVDDVPGLPDGDRRPGTGAGRAAGR